LYGNKDIEISYENLFDMRLLILKDVTHIRRMNKAMAEAKYKSIIMFTVTHELRTPTSSIKYML